MTSNPSDSGYGWDELLEWMDNVTEEEAEELGWESLEEEDDC